MRTLIDAVAATDTGAGLVRVRELARTLPSIRPDWSFLFVVRPEVASYVRDVAPGAMTLVPRDIFARSPSRLLWEHAWLPLRARSFGPEVVLAPFNTTPTVWPSPRPKIAVVVSNLAPYSEVANRDIGPRAVARNAALRVLTNRSLRAADRVFLQSRQAFELIGVDVLREKAEMLHPSPALAGAATGASRMYCPDKDYVITVADLYPFKAVETVIRAIAMTAPPKPVLLICGRAMDEGYARFLRFEVARLGVEEHVRFTGRLPHGDVVALMQSSTALVATSLFENLSKVPAEAMSVDVPVIASDIPSYREACGDAALYYPPAAAAELADAMQRVRSETSLRRHLVSQGKKRISLFDGKVAAREIVESLERLV